VPKIVGMLIDFEVFEISEIIEIITVDTLLIERV